MTQPLSRVPRERGHAGSRVRRATAGVSVLGSVATFAVAALWSPAAAWAADCAQPGTQIASVPWAQQMLGPQRVRSIADGSGVTVAVLDSGVDDAHQPQLAGRVVASTDFIQPSNTTATDCAGRGTQVAGIIAARQVNGVQFAGVAPNARLISARVDDGSSNGSGATAGTTGLASAIDWAVQRHAQVIDVSMATATDDTAVEASVAAAIAAGVVVVAAAGDSGDANGGDPVLYPAAYPGVIGVGAINPDGSRWDRSEHDAFVDLVAPGADVISTQTGGGLVGGLNGTSYAAAFVSGTAALVRQRNPQLTPAEVARQLFATATPAPGGVDDDEYGFGIVNPYSAVSDNAGGSPGALSGFHASRDDPAVRARDAAWRRSGTIAAIVAAVGVLVAFVVVGGARALPRGRRRRWRAAFAPPVRDDPDDEVKPPVQLFEEV